MQNDYEDVDFNFFWFDLIGLRNRNSHNKCWVNATLQGLKSCPAIREHWYNGISKTDNNNFVKMNLEIKAFLEGFLGLDDCWLKQCEDKIKLISKDSVDEAYETADFPWHLEETLLSSFGNARDKEIHELEEALDGLVLPLTVKKEN